VGDGEFEIGRGRAEEGGRGRDGESAGFGDIGDVNVEPLPGEELYVGFEQRESKDPCMVFAQESEIKNSQNQSSVLLQTPFQREKCLKIGI
jgi:hypothetical protein